MYSAGDLIQFDINDRQISTGKLSASPDEGKVEVSRLKENGKTGRDVFGNSLRMTPGRPSTSELHPKTYHGALIPPVVRSSLKLGERLGFLPWWGRRYVLPRRRRRPSLTLPVCGGGDSSARRLRRDDDEPASSNPSDARLCQRRVRRRLTTKGSEFEFADPAELDEEAAQFVRETHQAVHVISTTGTPTDKQGKAMKAFVERAWTIRRSIDTDNQTSRSLVSPQSLRANLLLKNAKDKSIKHYM